MFHLARFELHVKLGSYQNPFEKISMTWKLAEFGNINNQYHFSESRPGIAAKGEPSVVLRTWWFDKREERDAFLSSRHRIADDASNVVASDVADTPRK